MNNFITIIDLFITKKTSFKDFYNSWQDLYIKSIDSGLLDNLSKSDQEFLDEIHDKQDLVASEDELAELRKYNFMSEQDFYKWLVKFKHNKSELKNSAKEQIKDVTKPLYVKLGLFGVPTKKTANMYMYFCVVVSILSLILGFVLDQKYFRGSVFILAALWYYLSIIWMDKNNTWETK